jgi:hypothetical protein
MLPSHFAARRYEETRKAQNIFPTFLCLARFLLVEFLSDGDPDGLTPTLGLDDFLLQAVSSGVSMPPIRLLPAGWNH